MKIKIRCKIWNTWKFYGEVGENELYGIYKLSIDENKWYKCVFENELKDIYIYILLASVRPKLTHNQVVEFQSHIIGKGVIRLFS